ncbi:hypothetical protein MMC30_007243 [Trapelia coarctata]|nr:hypothetical protein [Trapelia coarctata]
MSTAGRDRQAAAGAALVEWMNNLPVSGKTSSISSLNDGYKIWNVLRDLDPEHFVGDLPEGPETSGKWVSRWQNLKHITKALISYITDVCGQTIPQDRSIADLKLIATDGHLAETVKAGLERRDATLQYTDDTIQLLKLVLIAAINSPKSQVYISAMLPLDEPSQQALRDLIEDVAHSVVVQASSSADIVQMQDTPRPTPDTEAPQNGAVVSSKPQTMDQELLFEERLGKVMADNENIKNEKRELQKDLRELHDRLARLQTNNDVLQEKLTKAEDILKQSGSARGARGEPYIKELETRLREQEDLIANQEEQISDYKISLQTSIKTLEKLQKYQEREQSLQDELDVTKVERDNLAKKANTLDKYKQKLQASQGLEKENQLLRGELEEVRQQYQETEQIRQELAGLERAIEEYKRILSKTEQDCHDLQVMKKQLEFNNATLAQRCEQADGQHLRDEQIIADLQAKSQTLDSTRSSGIGPVGGLDAELENSEKKEEQQNLALKGRGVGLSKSFADVNSKAIMLQKLLDDANGKHKEMEKKYFDLLEKYMILQSSLNGVPEGQNGGKDAAELGSELALIKGALREGLRQSEGERMPATTPPTGSHANNEEAGAIDIDSENFDVVDILSKFNYKEVENLRKENAELRTQGKTRRTKGGLEPEGNIFEEDMKALLEQIEAATGGRTSKHASASVNDFSGDLRKMITEVRERTAKRQQVQQQSILSNIIERVEKVLVPKSSAATPPASKKWNWPGRQKLTQRNSTSTSKTPK